MDTQSTIPAEDRQRMNVVLDEEYLTVAEAAKALKVSPSTIWRWIDQGDLPAYRAAHRRVRIKKADITRVITPARRGAEKGARMAQKERELLLRPLTRDEQQRALAALAAAEALQQQLLERRGGKPFPPSWKDLDKARVERTRYLQ